MLRLKSLGHTLIEAGDVQLTPTAETVFATALYLIIEAARPIGRDEMTRLLWPGVSEAQAQHGLRQALYRLKTLGATIKADRKSITLSPRFCTTDFGPLLAPQSVSALEALADTIDGSFLPGYRPALSDEFATWVERQRDIVHSAVARTLVAGIQAKKRVSDWNSAEQLAGLCLSVDSLNEEATLTMAEAAALGGSKTKALSILNNYLTDIGEGASEIKLPAALLKRRISEAYQENLFPVRDAQFVGREAEQQVLIRALERAQGGIGSATVLWGEAGIGKSRLLSEFIGIASLQRVQIVRVECQPHDVRRPLSAFVDLIPKLLTLRGALGCSPESMAYLRRLIEHNPDDFQTRGESEQFSERYDTARRALLDLLEAVSAETTSVIHLEDIHWLDEQSTLMISEIGEWLKKQRILLVATSRNATLASQGISGIAVRPLAAPACATVAKSFIRGSRANEDAFLEWCVTSSGGNPFYLLELLRHATEDYAGFRAPASLSSLLRDRVRSLGTDAKRLLEVCCILGKHSTFARIESCTRLPRFSLLNGLDELDNAGMLEMDGARILSRHDLLTAAVLSEIQLPVKAMVHRFVAEELEEEASRTQSVSLIWESAEHWHSAADADRAISLLRQCGNHLMDVGMPLEAARVLERAEMLCMSAEQRYSLGAARARALMVAEESGAAALVLEKLLIVRKSLVPCPSILDEVGVMYMHARWQNGETVRELIEDRLHALSIAQATPLERVRAAAWLLTAADNLCDLQLGKDIYFSISSELFDKSIPEDLRLSLQMIFHCTAGEPELALIHAAELVEYAKKNCPAIVVQRHLRHASHVHNCHSDLSIALRTAEEAYRYIADVSSPRSAASCAGQIGWILMQMEELDECDLWLRRAEELSSNETNRVAAMNLSSYRMELSIRRKDWEGAQQYLSICAEVIAKNSAVRSRIRQLAFESQIAVLRNVPFPPDSLAEFSRLFALAKNCCFQDFNAEALLVLLERIGEFAEARKVATSFIEHRRDIRPITGPLSRAIERSLRTPLPAKW